jgi:ABC-type lipoprotein export system ATPase subunit
VSELIVARDVKRSYDVRGQAVEALRPTSVTVHPGDVVVVTGPSGTGKSTLVSILAGWDQPTSGTVERTVRTVFVPQRVALIDALSVLDNIALADVTRTDEVRELAATLGVDHLLDRFPGETSLGERQRVGLARALHARAVVTILDEPTAHQDADHTTLVLEAIAAPASDRAVVIATHDPVVVEVATAAVQLEAAVLAS